MYKLNNKEFGSILHLVTSRNELSVLSVINGVMPGEIYVNNIDNPTAALIQTSECNLISGSTNDAVFNSEVSSELDFWDQLVPDSMEWIDIIPTIHKNPFVRKYKRRHYSLSIDDFMEPNIALRDGFVIEKLNLDILRNNSYENAEKLREWVENWGDDTTFLKYGAGYYIHNGKVIVSWSLSDCSYDKKIAIGIHTDERYRNNGFGKIVVSATIKDCFSKGYEIIDWLCVDSNKGSSTIAEKLGFKYNNDYYSFASYPPIENINDLSESEWYEWGEYLENASKTEDCLIWDCLYCYIKANDVEKTIHIMTSMENKKIIIDYSKFKNYLDYLQNYGMCSNFRNKDWFDFLNKVINN
jgi:RimJ/RimL family protein N-acetyltransferase